MSKTKLFHQFQPEIWEISSNVQGFTCWNLFWAINNCSYLHFLWSCVLNFSFSRESINQVKRCTRLPGVSQKCCQPSYISLAALFCEMRRIAVQTPSLKSGYESTSLVPKSAQISLASWHTSHTAPRKLRFPNHGDARPVLSNMYPAKNPRDSSFPTISNPSYTASFNTNSAENSFQRRLGLWSSESRHVRWRSLAPRGEVKTRFKEALALFLIIISHSALQDICKQTCKTLNDLYKKTFAEYRATARSKATASDIIEKSGERETFIDVVILSIDEWEKKRAVQNYHYQWVQLQRPKRVLAIDSDEKQNYLVKTHITARFALEERRLKIEKDRLDFESQKDKSMEARLRLAVEKKTKRIWSDGRKMTLEVERAALDREESRQALL